MVRLNVTATETIERPLREVRELSCDVARHPEWVPATLAVLRSDHPARLGSTDEERNRLAGPLTTVRNLKATAEGAI